jgi:hypothetical protein|tara:strand:- start:80 stop:316 length:237 start_codon:yes stop_codon:yes gene_type:complete
MKVGDMVRSVPVDTRDPDRWGLVVDLIQKKCWRTWRDGKNVNWDLISPEAHAVVLFPWNDGLLTIPTIQLEVFERFAC